VSARACVRACVRYLSIFLSISLSLSIHAHIYVVQRANNEQRCWSMCIFTRTHARTHAHTHTHTHTHTLSLSLSLKHKHICLSVYLFISTPPTHIAAATGWRQCQAQLAGHAMRRRHNPPHAPLCPAALLRPRFPRHLRSLGPAALLKATRGGGRVESSTGAACRTTCSPTAAPSHGAVS